MAENSAIEWTDHTFNPWIGCTKISPACDHCYAESFVRNRMGKPELWQGERHRTAESTWKQPLAWNRKAEREGVRKRVFCASLADVFDNQVPASWRVDLWQLIGRTPHLDWLLLTKRPQNIRKMLPPAGIERMHQPWGDGWPNVWLGTTVENQDEARKRIPHLLAVPAHVHFLSCEPLLGPLDLSDIWPDMTARMSAFSGKARHMLGMRQSVGKVGWVITGGESGPGARPSHPDWFRSLRDQCAAAGVPFLFKQWGDWRLGISGQSIAPDGSSPGPSAWNDPTTAWVERIGKKAAGRLLDGVLHDGYPAKEEVPA